MGILNGAADRRRARLQLAISCVGGSAAEHRGWREVHAAGSTAHVIAAPVGSFSIAGITFFAKVPENYAISVAVVQDWAPKDHFDGLVGTTGVAQSSERRMPGSAAVMGFFLPWVGAFYCGKVTAGVSLLVIDIIFFALSVVGNGLFFLFLYGFAGARQCHKWAKEANAKKLQELMALQQQQPRAAQA